MTNTANHHAIILFDGVCNFCNSSVRFIIERDSGKRFRFASLQSPYAVDLLNQHGEEPGKLNTIVLLQDGILYKKSSAALQIAQQLDGLWPAMAIFKIVPAFIRDAVYNFIARYRYRWFGKQDSCPVPPPGIQERFISTET
ncbi:MAG: hypothetical protein BRD50_04145 [Bacteroidetes bacterium SW_11_45_7]|nr:MAG: hypothetical protein BRD50_04145 [Bacteroidetes bacterium SW_11_45_7]